MNGIKVHPAVGEHPLPPGKAGRRQMTVEIRLLARATIRDDCACQPLSNLTMLPAAEQVEIQLNGSIALSDDLHGCVEVAPYGVGLLVQKYNTLET